MMIIKTFYNQFRLRLNKSSEMVYITLIFR